MKLLAKNDIETCDDLVTEDVEVPEWGGTVRVRSMTARDKDSFDMRLVKLQEGGKSAEINRRNIRASLVVASVIDDKGERLFSDDDVEMLGAKNGVAIDRVFAVASRLSLLNPDDAEELAGN